MEALLLTAFVALAGSLIGIRLRIPAGALIGAMVSVAVFNIITDAAYMPMELKTYTQAATGAFLGAKLTRSDVADLRRILKPALLLAAAMLTFTVGMGVLISAISRLSIPTALFAMAPGSIAEMTLASMDFADSEPSAVALIQTIRVIFSILLIPLVARCLPKGSFTACAQGGDKAGGGMDLFWTLLIGLVCGLAGKASGIPGGAISFSMAGCAAWNLTTNRGYLPLKLRQLIQAFAGALVGCTVGMEEVRILIELYGVVLLAIGSFVALDVAAALVISRCTDMDLLTAIFASAPGGLTDMALIAEDMGADSPKIAGMHTIRLVSVVALYPPIIHFLVDGLGGG